MTALRIQPPEEEESLLDAVLDWVAAHFDATGDELNGDLYGAAQVAALRLAKSGRLAAFWKEFGPDVVAHYYKLRRIHRDRRPHVEDDETTDTSAVRAASLYGLWKEQVPSKKRWLLIADLTDEDAREVGERYVKAGAATLRRGEAFLDIAKKLKRGQTIGDKFSVDELSKFFEAQ